MNIGGWLLFIVILGIDLAIYAMISMQMDGTWDKIHKDTYDK
tara:strand:- start:639 stop:764 length:126 start_codon:yes stop_codon:yes gene_type:complete